MAVKKQFSSLSELLDSSSSLILVDFYATWCGPCLMMAPILEEVKQQMGDRIMVVKIDTDKYSNLASTYHIEALPTLVLFKNGKEINRIEGLMQTPDLIAHLEKAVA